MAQAGYTPISLYYSTTAATTPTAGNLVPGELAINITDGKLYYEDNAGVVKLLAQAPSGGGTFAAPVVIEGTTTSAALRITQLGTGNALLVEDSTNPDSTPFVIDSLGKVFVGATSAQNPYSGRTTSVEINSLSSTLEDGLALSKWANTSTGNFIVTSRSRGSLGVQTILNNSDTIGGLVYQGSDGVGFIRAATIEAIVDGTPGTNDMPGRLVFSTTADGASSPTERMRITNSGTVGIGGTPSSVQRFLIGGSQSLGSAAQIILNQQTLQSDATGTSAYYDTFVNLQATAFTAGTVNHYRAVQTALTGGAAITNQRGFSAEAGLTGATNNYGFYGNIPAATGRWNFYAAGTADNYFAGNVGIGTTTPSAQLQVAGNSSTSALKIPNIEEVATISATAATGTINYDITTQSVLFYTSNASANWTVNFRGSSGTSLNTLMQTGESMSCTFLATQGATAYYNSVVQVDGTTSGVTTRWQGSAPTSGNASSLDSYTYVIIKTGSATFTVLATQTKFA